MSIFKLEFKDNEYPRRSLGSIEICCSTYVCYHRAEQSVGRLIDGKVLRCSPECSHRLIVWMLHQGRGTKVMIDTCFANLIPLTTDISTGLPVVPV